MPLGYLGYTDQVAHFMQMSDFFVGKPGPGSVSGALRVGLPVVVVDNAWTMPQERYNAQWVRDEELGIVVTSARAIPEAAAQLIGGLERYQSRVHRS